MAGRDQPAVLLEKADPLVTIERGYQAALADTIEYFADIFLNVAAGWRHKYPANSRDGRILRCGRTTSVNTAVIPKLFGRRLEGAFCGLLSCFDWNATFVIPADRRDRTGSAW